MERLPRPYLYDVPDRSNADVQVAFYECFSAPAGQVVLDRLYWQVMMREPADLREVGQQDLFRLLVQNIQLGSARVHGRLSDGDGYDPAE